MSLTINTPTTRRNIFIPRFHTGHRGTREIAALPRPPMWPRGTRGHYGTGLVAHAARWIVVLGATRTLLWALWHTRPRGSSRGAHAAKRCWPGGARGQGVLARGRTRPRRAGPEAHAATTVPAQGATRLKQPEGRALTLAKGQLGRALGLGAYAGFHVVYLALVGPGQGGGVAAVAVRGRGLVRLVQVAGGD